MANRTETKVEAAQEASAAVKPEDVKLPAYFDLAKAAGVAGMKNAQSLLDEVLMITSGDLSQHQSPGVSLRALEAAAEDETNESAIVLRDKIKRIKATFAEYQNNKTADQQ